MRKIGLFIVTMLLTLIDVQQARAEQDGQSLDVFCGVSLSYSETTFNRLYNVVLNAAPGVKWNLGKDWQVSGQVYIPIVNDMGKHYDRVRVNMAAVSKELSLQGDHHIKMTAGLFSRERYGLDVKYIHPITDWLAVTGQVGFTGYCSMAEGWECERMNVLTFIGGANVFLSPWNTEFRVSGGRYIAKDYGMVGEVMRHFKYCTIGAYAQLQEKTTLGPVGKNDSKTNGGFKVIVMLPPYKKSSKKIRIRPATNFRQVYNARSDRGNVRMYKTDPEENEREGNFNPANVRWGANLIGVGGVHASGK